MAHESVATPWERKGAVMREMVERAGTRDVVLVDGVKVLHPDGWALVLPDPPSRVGRDKNAIHSVLSNDGQSGVDLFRPTHFDGHDRDSEFWSGGLHVFQLSGGVRRRRIEKYRDAFYGRYDFLQHFQALRREIGMAIGQTCDVAAGASKALDYPGAKRIGVHGHHDRNFRLPYRGDGGRAIDDDDVHLAPDQVCGELRQATGCLRAMAELKDDVSTFNIPELAQPLAKCIDPMPISFGRRGGQVADAPDSRLCP